MRGVPKGKPAFHARVSLVCRATLVRHHPNDLVAFELGFERAAHTTISTGRYHTVLGLTLFYDRLFHQGCGRARLNAGATRHAIRVQERLVLTRGNLGIKASAINCKREGALHLFAGTHTTRAHNTFAGIKGKIGMARIRLSGQMIFTFKPVADRSKTDFTRDILQLTIAIGRTR